MLNIIIKNKFKKLNKKIWKESIHQQFERFMRDEMDDEERALYIRSKNYQEMIKLLTDTLKILKKIKI